MSAKKNYWEECVAIAAEECELTLTPYQLEYLAGAVENGHEYYGQAFYSPPSSDRVNVIEQEAAEKFKRLQAEFDAYRSDAETAVKKALKLYNDTQVTIGKEGEVLSHGGRTERVL